MNFLTVNHIKAIDVWMNKNARKIDIAKWDYLFNNGNKDCIVKEMLTYQNEDGGFGNGFEADILLPLSASVPSAEAILTAYDFELDCTADWFKKLLDYFENTIQTTPSFWESAPKEFEDYPHAPWWSYRPDTIFSPNPCAVIASALIMYGTQKQKEIGNHVATKCIEFLNGDDFCGDHDCFNLQRLYLILQYMNSLLINQDLASSMNRRILNNVCFDESKWMEYVPQPLDIIDNPKSQWYDLVSKGIEKNFEFWIKNLKDEGVWTPNFSWGIDSEISHAVTKNWTGYIAVKRARIFKNFYRISL